MNNSVKFAMFNVLTTNGISTPEIVDMITEYKIKEFYFNSQFEGEERQIHRWICSNGKYSEIKTWYRNGVLQSWCTTYDKRLHGFLLEWYESGIMSKRIYYNHGSLRQDITNIMWYENGELSSLKEPTFHKTWYPSGRLSSYIELGSKGERQGFCVRYDYEFQKEPSIKWYENGEEIPIYNVKWKNGSIVNEHEVIIINIDTNQYNIDNKKEKGKIIEEIYYKNGKKHGKILEYYYDNSLCSVTWYSNGLKHGSYRAWHMSYGTSMEMKGTYYKDKKDGKWYVYRKGGILQEIIKYDKGQKLEHKFFDQNGIYLRGV